MQLLLIDDASDRLERIETVLADLQPDWRVIGAQDPEFATSIMTGTRCDAVVAASSRGPRIVIDILRKAKSLTPGALRIAVANGEADTRMLINAEVAHRVSLAPLSAERLIAGLKSVRVLETMLGNEALRMRIAKIERLPPTPGVALALIRENADGTADMAGVAERLRGDSALTAKVLQLSNMAHFSRGTPVLEIERALTRLGLDTVINLVLAVESFAPGGDSGMQNRAVLASQIAVHVLRKLKKVQSCSIAATAATLADIGKLLPLRDEPKPKAAPKRVVTDDDDDFNDIFIASSSGRRIDPDDLDEFFEPPPIESVAGAYLLSLWGLPWPIIEAVAYRHKPAMASDDDFGITAAVHTACALASGEPLDEGLLEGFGVMGHVPEWTAEALLLGAPPRPK